MTIKNVLIVDDSKTSRAQLSKLLRDYDLQINTAESAEEAIDFLQQRQPDAIFLDHTMPGMDGLQALKIIKENPGTSLIPVAMYTSKDDNTYAEQVRAEGAVDILYKPPTPSAVSGVFGKLDEAFLSASANVAKMPEALQPAEAIPSALQGSPSSVEDVVSSTVRVQLASVIKTRLTPMFEEKINNLTLQLQDSVEQSTAKLVDRAVAAGDEKVRSGISGEAKKLRTDLEQLLDSHRATLDKDLQLKLGDLKKEMHENVVHFNEESAQKIEQALAARVTMQMVKQSEKFRSQLYWLSGLALILGLVALVLHGV